MIKILSDFHFYTVHTTEYMFEKVGYIIPTVTALTSNEKRIVLCKQLKDNDEVADFKKAIQIILAVEKAVMVSFTCGALFSKSGVLVKGVSVTTCNRKDGFFQTNFKIEKHGLESIDSAKYHSEFFDLLTTTKVTPEMEKFADECKTQEWYIAN